MSAEGKWWAFEAFASELERQSNQPDKPSSSYLQKMPEGKRLRDRGLVRQVNAWFRAATRFHLPHAAHVVDLASAAKLGDLALRLPTSVTALLDDAGEHFCVDLRDRDTGDWIKAPSEPTRLVLAMQIENVGTPAVLINCVRLFPHETLTIGDVVCAFMRDGQLVVEKPLTGRASAEYFEPPFGGGTPPSPSELTAALSVLNLTCMLALDNVRAAELPVPEAVNRKRARQGKKPLFSYHVLEVDGEKWDRRCSDGAGSTVRSHLRRGHIRRLHDGRNVWVRACFVRGGTPGFVDKDYNVKVAA